MPKATVEEVKYDLLPEDTLFTATLLEVGEREIEYQVKKVQANGKKPGERDSFTKWEWKFKIKGGEFDGTWVWGETDARVTSHPENKPRTWGEILLGRSIDIGQDFDTADFVGLSCRLEVIHETYKDKYGEDKTTAKVLQLFKLDDAGWGTQDPPF